MLLERDPKGKTNLFFARGVPIFVLGAYEGANPFGAGK
jgi:hypothetical protein